MGAPLHCSQSRMEQKVGRSVPFTTPASGPEPGLQTFSLLVSQAMCEQACATNKHVRAGCGGKCQVINPLGLPGCPRFCTDRLAFPKTPQSLAKLDTWLSYSPTGEVSWKIKVFMDSPPLTFFHNFKMFRLQLHKYQVTQL